MIPDHFGHSAVHDTAFSLESDALRCAFERAASCIAARHYPDYPLGHISFAHERLALVCA